MKTNKLPKTFWNYRVILDKDEDGNAFYSIREVHYDNYGKKIFGWDEDAMELIFSQGDSISSVFRHLKLALDQPVLVVKGKKLKEIDKRPAGVYVSRDVD